jgi:hypothetical protein
VLDAAQKECVVLTRQGQPSAIVVGVEGLDAEQVALGIDDELWLEIEQARAEGKYVSAARMKRDLGLRNR